MSRIGPTGEPRRSADELDQGGIRAGMKLEGEFITIHFGTTLSFLRMSRTQAEHFGRELLRLSQKLPPGQITVEKALDESVKLQGHYAKLLNEYDGGERMIFETAGDWIHRLEVLALERQ